MLSPPYHPGKTATALEKIRGGTIIPLDRWNLCPHQEGKANVSHLRVESGQLMTVCSVLGSRNSMPRGRATGTQF
jgi:hypothetical protein